MLTVPAFPLTATRGKSLIGKRLYPGMNAPSRETTGTASLAAGPLHEAFAVWVRQLCGIRTSTSLVAALAHGARLVRFVPDRKSTRLNSSHRCISYAVFCLT